MNIEEVFEKLTKEIPSSKVMMEEPMSKHTTFKIGGNADIYIKVATIQDIKYILRYVKENNIPLTVIGNGSNLLVRDGGVRGITMQINLEGIDIKDELVTAEAGVKLAKLGVETLNASLTGFEFASGIPGTIGGAIRMNAGAYGGEFKDIVYSVTYITRDGEIKTISNEEANFSYRHSRFVDNDDIVISTTLKLEKGNPEEIKAKMDELMLARRTKQPLELPSAGSTFKRGSDFYASKIIDEAGLKGYQIGGARISDKHTGFVVNVDNAKAKDVLELTDFVKTVIYKKYGKIIELEVEIIGED